MNDNGKVITVRGLVEPKELGRVLMHEHLYCHMYDWEQNAFIEEETPVSAARRDLIMNQGIPSLRQCNDHGCHALLEVTPAPWRAWPTFTAEASTAAGMHIIQCTGFYREVEFGTYWVKKPEYSAWSFVREATVEKLAEFCTWEILEGIRGTGVRAGAIKLGSSAAVFTPAEEKAFRAGARAQKATGVHITTHCTVIGAETTQLRLLEAEGVDLSRVVIGHTGSHLMKPESRRVCMDWMRRGANFMPTNLVVQDREKWRPLVGAFHEIFDAGLGGHLTLSLDCGFCSETVAFRYCSFIPPPPFLYMFTETLPALRALGLTPEEEETILATNPQRILPVRR